MTFSWLFQCTPFVSNFVWSIDATSCVNYDYFRWCKYNNAVLRLRVLMNIAWIGLSLSIDFLILIVPLQILKRSQAQRARTEGFETGF